jgi:hypothetical protein
MARNKKRNLETRKIHIEDGGEFTGPGADLHRRIAEKAYELYECRGCCHGREPEQVFGWQE